MIFTKKNGDTMTLHTGDCIIYEGRTLPVRIEIVYSNGFTYLPWRGTRWATPVSTFLGDPRFICREGNGQKINWDSIKLVPNPEKIAILKAPRNFP